MIGRTTARLTIILDIDFRMPSFGKINKLSQRNNLTNMLSEHET